MNSIHTSLINLISVVTLFALSACGGSSGSGNNQPPPPDNTPPTVSAVAVPPGSSLNRTVTLSATASDSGGVREVRFLVDGALAGTDTTSPYSFDWDTSSVADGDHVLRVEAEDAAGNIQQSAEVTVTITNVTQFMFALSADEQVPTVASQGVGQADITIDLATGAVSGGLTTNGITPTDAHIHDAFAGANGAVLIALDQDPMNPGSFSAPAGATLDAAGIDRLAAGALYVNVHTAEFPAGELRGQILPEDLVVRFASLEGEQSVPIVYSLATGSSAVTLNVVTGAIVVEARANNLADATQAHVHEAYAGNTGPVLVALNQDAADPGRWFVDDGTLNNAGLDAFAAGRLYVNIHSPANAAGELRGQILPDGVALLFAELSGEQQVPAAATRATGLAAVTLDAAASQVTLHVNTTAIDDASAAHLHGAFGGVNGPVEIGLTVDGGNPSHWLAEEEALTNDQLNALLAGATYVNVHTPDNPGGEIRGQVIPDDIIFATGRLEGSQQVPAVDTTASGTLAVTVDPAALTLVAHANTIDLVDPTAAHIHDAYAGTSGGVAIGLTQDQGEASRWSADNAAITADQLAALESGRLYINVHTATHAPGEIRGQIAPRPVEVLITTLGGNQEVPAVASAASATAASTVNRDSGTVTLHLRATGADDATAAHIHSAYAGQTGGVAVGLAQDAGDAGHWFVTAAQLDDMSLSDYVEGRLYVNLHTPANPAGELRGQIAPRDQQIVFSAMSGDQVVPSVVTASSGSVATTTDLKTRRFVAFVNGAGVDDATAAGIRMAGAGMTGAEILALQQTPALLSQWSAMIDPLDAAAFSAYRAGRLYAQINTPAEPGGELRGQIVPPNAVDFDDLAPNVALNSPGSPVSGTVTLDADANDDQGVTEVRFLVGGVVVGTDATPPYSADWDTTASANGDVTLTAEAEDAAGNVGTSANVVVAVNNAVPVTLTEIQADVFGQICSGCHSGPTSGSLPSGMDLSSAANSFADLVNVPSLQVELDRVEPGDPDGSYLIRKLEGGPNISGSRMPQGGPFLDQATIDRIRQWIADDALNN